jgi:hypothetical protein
MSQVLLLQMPTDAAYHALAAEAAGRICALAGGDSNDAQVFGAELTTALESLVGVADSVALEFEADEAAIRVRLTCGNRAQDLRRSWSKPVR